MKIGLFVLLGIILTGSVDMHACSIIYYIDPGTGKKRKIELG